MTRAVFFVDSINESDGLIGQYALQLAHSLAQLSVEVTVLTRDNGQDLPPLPSHGNLNILFPFKNWKFHELAFALPLFMQLQADAVHVFQPQLNHGFFSFYNHVFDLLELHQNKPVKKVFSLFNLQSQSLQASPLLHRSDWITAQYPHVLEQLGSNKQMVEKTKYIPLYAEFNNSSSGRSELVEIDDTGRFLILPCNADQLLDSEISLHQISALLQLHSELQIVFTGGWGQISPRRRQQFWKNLASAKDAQRIRFIESDALDSLSLPNAKAKYLWLSPIDPSRMNFSEPLNWAFENEIPVLIDREHFSHPSLVANKHYLPCSQALSQVHHYISHPQDIGESVHSEAVAESSNALLDHPANLITRLYCQ